MNLISSKQHKFSDTNYLLLNTPACYEEARATRKATLNNFLNKQYVAMCVSQFRTSLVLCRVLSEFCRVCAKKKLPVPSLTSSALGATLAAFPLLNSFQMCRIFMIFQFCDHTTVFVVVVLKQFKG